MRKTTLALALAAAALSHPAAAHVTILDPVATAGKPFRAAFKVGHGCDGSATTSVSILIPDGVVAVKPMPKPGWTLEVKKERLAKPYETHGKTITEDVKRVTWSGGPLPDAFYDEFVMQLRAPETPGKLYFKAEQVCEKGRWDWVEIPAAGKTRRDYRAPAAELEVRAAPGAHAH